MADRPRHPWGKWRLFAIYWALQLPLSFFLFALVAGGSLDICGEREYQLLFGSVAICVMIAQAAFLLPVRPPRPGPERPWSRTARCALAGAACGLMGAVAIYALMITADTTGLVPLNGPGPYGWSFWAIAGAAAVIATAFFLMLSGDRPSALVSVVIAGFGAAALTIGIPWVTFSVADTLLKKEPSSAAFACAVVATLLLNWAIATPLLLRFLRRPPAAPLEDRLARIAAWLFLGSVLEAAAVIPLNVMVRRKTSCYCGEGTLWSVTICWGLGTLVLGPAVWLIPLGRRRKRWASGSCDACGYEMTACPGAERCPECGAGWRAEH